MSAPHRIGIVGTGMIGNVMARAIQLAEGAEVTAVASRRVTAARSFAENHAVAEVFDTWRDLVTCDAIDTVYVATPTAVREEICIAAARAGKHVLGDKPFASLASLERITTACQASGVAFMDATHFVHHPRTRQLRATMNDHIGRPHSVHSMFFFPAQDRTNIRFNPAKEPTGALGDMAWYCMRAIVEYMPESLVPKSIDGLARRDAQTGAVVGGAGVTVFENGNTSTWHFGYDAGVCLMELDILGTDGMIHLDDFVLDWSKGLALEGPDHRVGYTRRAGVMTPADFEFIETPGAKPQAVSMIEDFMALTAEPTGEAVRASIAASKSTQRLLDAAWDALK